MGTDDPAEGYRLDGESNDRRLNRRRLLGVLGAGSVSLAGCLSGSDGSDEPGDDESDDESDDDPMETQADDESDDDSSTESDATTTEADETKTAADSEDETTEDGDEEVDCTDLKDGGYTRYDEDDSPFVGTFEHPGSVTATGTFNNDHSLTIRLHAGGEPFDFFPGQKLVGTDSPTDAEKGELDGLERIDEVEFDGETRPVIKASADGNADDEVQRYDQYPYYIVGLPFEGSSGKKYYRFQVQATVNFGDLEPRVCESTYEELALHALNSLEPNPDSTVEEEGVD